MDNSKITIGLKCGVWAISIGGISGIALFWNKIKQILFWSFNIKIWYCCVFLLLFFLILWIIIKILKKEESFKEENDASRPDQLIKDYGTQKIHEVLWKIWDGKNINDYGTDFDEVELWIEGPFCPKCKCKLSRDKNKWVCPKCLRKFTIPKEIRKNLNSKIRKIIEVDMRNNV